MRLEKIVNRRTRELQSSTRSEILVSIGAALLFVVVMVWRFPPAQNRIWNLDWVPSSFGSAESRGEIKTHPAWP